MLERKQVAQKGTQVRQGDVLLTPEVVDPAVLKKAKRVAPEHGKYVLRRGELTGHDHVVMATGKIQLYDAGDGGMFLVVDEPTQLVHTVQHGEAPDHAPLPVKEGIYRVRGQREYEPGAIRDVRD